MNLSTSRFSIHLPLAAAALLSIAALAPAVRADEWVKSYAVSGRPQIRVETNDGAVRVYTSDTKQVEFKVEYHGYVLDKDLIIRAAQSGDKFEIEAKLSSHWCVFCVNVNRGLRIEVRMPKDSDLYVHTGDGAVEAEAVNGNVDINTGDGHIMVDGARGDIHLRSGDGHIEARNIDGKLEANSGDGSMRIDGRFDVLNIKTGDGSIDARANSGSKVASSWNIHTGDGSVDLVLPEGFAANVNAETGDGRISFGFPLTIEAGGLNTSHVSGKLNGGGSALSIRTGDGSIRLRKA